MVKIISYIITISTIIIFLTELLFAEIIFFPDEILVDNPHGALLRSPALDVLYISSVKDNKDFMGYNFGTKIPMLSFDSNDIKYQFGGFGGIYTRFELFTYSFNFVHADFQGGIFGDVKLKKIYFETMLYHVSSHIGDDYIYYNGNNVVDTGYEAIRHYTTYSVMPILDFTLGFEYKSAKRPEDRIFYDKSLLIGNRINFYTEEVPIFFEGEIEIIGFKNTPNVGIKGGIYLSYLFNNILLGNDLSSDERHEFSVYYYYGYSKMGYFYNNRESLFLAGPTYRF